MKCSRTAHGFGSGNAMASVAEPSHPQSSLEEWKVKPLGLVDHILGKRATFESWIRLIVRYLLFSLVLFRLHPAFAEAASSPVVTIQSAPERPIIESRDRNQFLNFDLIVRNVSKLTLRLSEIQLAVYDSTHSLVMMKSLNTDAFQYCRQLEVTYCK
jgi:hypothetical protein